jgi:hypothetical protein
MSRSRKPRIPIALRPKTGDEPHESREKSKPNTCGPTTQLVFRPGEGLQGRGGQVAEDGACARSGQGAFSGPQAVRISAPPTSNCDLASEVVLAGLDGTLLIVLSDSDARPSYAPRRAPRPR